MKPETQRHMLIRLSVDETRFSWSFRNEHSVLTSGDQTSFIKPDPPFMVRVLVPSTYMLFREVTVTKSSRQTLNWALEEFSLADPAQFHITILRRENTTHHIVAVEHSRMKAWIARLAEIDIRPDMLLPDCLALTEGEYMTLDDDYIARDRLWQGYSISVQNQPVLARLRKPQQPLKLHNGGLDSLHEGLNGVSLSLLKGAYSVKPRRNLPRFAYAAATLSLILSLAVPPLYTGLKADYLAWKNQEQALDITLSFAEANSVADIPATLQVMSEKLAIQKKQHSIMSAIEQRADLITQLATNIRSITWSPMQQTLILNLNTPISTEEFSSLITKNSPHLSLSTDQMTLTASSHK